MKLFAIILLALLTLLSSTVQAATESKKFMYTSEEITVHPQDGFFILDLDPSLFHALDPTLRDLRLYVGEQEVGYARLPIIQGKEAVNRKEIPVNFVNAGFYDNGTYGFVVNMSTLHKLPDALTVKLNQEPYVVKGTLFGSQDNHTWQSLRSITLFGIENRYNEISLKGIDYPYLKIVYAEGKEDTHTIKEAFAISNNQAKSLQKINLIKPTFKTLTDQTKQETQITADLAFTHFLSGKISIASSEKNFYRRVQLEGTNDKEATWEAIQSSYIYRGLESSDELLSIDYQPSAYRYLRLRIFNEDNAPIPITSLSVTSYPLQILAKVPSTLKAQQLKIKAYWGNKDVTSPLYDVEKFINSFQPREKNIFYIKHAASNPEYEQAPLPKKPFTEEYPFLMPAGLVLASLVVGLILFRTVKQAN